MQRQKYILDVNTRNISFLQTAKDLKTLGIMNNMFFLKLYDVSLRGVDPYSPFLTQEQIMRVINECIINPWYFLREIARIPEQGGTGIPYQLNRANLAATWCYLNGLDHYLVIPRQIGKTQSTVAIILWTFLFGTSNSEIMFSNKNQDDAAKNLKRLKEQRDLLPKYLQFKLAFDEEGKVLKETDNVRTLSNSSNNNSIVAKPSARSMEAGEGIGRGCTQPIQYYDEVEFTPFIKTIVEAAGPAFNTASENAKRNNAPYCRVFTSTPGDLDTQPGQDALLIIEKTCKWSEKFYDWSKDDIEEYVSTNSGNGIIYIEYQYQQLGKDENWFRKTCQTLLNNPLKIKREIFLQRMRGSSESPYDPEELAAIEELKGQVKEEIFINKLFKLDLYEPLKRDRVYLVGVDVSDGYGQDNSATTILDPYTLKPVAEFKSPYIGLTAYSKFLHTLIRKHIPRAILCIERNSVGEAILENLRNTDVRGNLYYDSSKDFIGSHIDDKMDSQGMLKVEAARRKLYGVYTQGKSREIMFSLLDTHIKEMKERFVTNNIVSDLMSLVRTKRGKIEAAPGFHDDSLMSYLIALYVYYHGNNLHIFGFVRGELPNEETRNKGLTYEEVYDEMPDDVKETFSNFSVKSGDDYNEMLVQEIAKARQEMRQVDMLLNPINTVEDYDREYEEGSISLDFFDELNQ